MRIECLSCQELTPHQTIQDIRQEPARIEQLLLFFENGFYSIAEFVRAAQDELGEFGREWAENTVRYAEYEAS